MLTRCVPARSQLSVMLSVLNEVTVGLAPGLLSLSASFFNKHTLVHPASSRPPSLLNKSFVKADFVCGARWTPAAVRVMDEMLETYLVSLLEDANLAAIHAGRTMVQPRDLQLCRRIRLERS